MSATKPEDAWLIEARAQTACVEALMAMGEETAARRLVRHLAGVSTDLSVEVVLPFGALVGERPR